MGRHSKKRPTAERQLQTDHQHEKAPFHLMVRNLGVAGVMSFFPRTPNHLFRYLKEKGLSWRRVVMVNFPEEHLLYFNRNKYYVETADDLFAFVATVLGLLESTASRKTVVEFMERFVSVNGYSRCVLFATSLSMGPEMTEAEETQTGLRVLQGLGENLADMNAGIRPPDEWGIDFAAFTRHMCVKLVGLMLYLFLVRKQGIPCISTCKIERLMMGVKKGRTDPSVGFYNFKNVEVDVEYMPFPESHDDFAFLKGIDIPDEMKRMLALVSTVSSAALVAKISGIRMTNEVAPFPHISTLIPSPSDAVSATPYLNTWLASFGMSMLPSRLDGKHFMKFNPNDTEIYDTSMLPFISEYTQLTPIHILASMVQNYGNVLSSGYGIIADMNDVMPPLGKRSAKEIRAEILHEAKYAMWPGATEIVWKERSLESIIITPLSDKTFFVADTVKIDISKMLGVAPEETAIFPKTLVPYYFFTRLPAIDSEREWKTTDTLTNMELLHQMPLEAIRMAVVGKEKRTSETETTTRFPTGYVRGKTRPAANGIGLQYIPRLEIVRGEAGASDSDDGEHSTRQSPSHVFGVVGHVRQIPMDYEASPVCRKRAEDSGIALPQSGFTYVASYFKGAGEDGIKPETPVVKKMRVSGKRREENSETEKSE